MSSSDAKYLSGVRTTLIGRHAYKKVHHSVVLHPSRRLDRAEYREGQLLVETHLRKVTKLSPPDTPHSRYELASLVHSGSRLFALFFLCVRCPRLMLTRAHEGAFSETDGALDEPGLFGYVVRYDYVRVHTVD